MNRIPPKVRAPMLQRLSAVIRNELAPTEENDITAIKRGLLDSHSRNSSWAQTLTGVLSVRQDLLLSEEDLPSLEAATELVEALERQPLMRFSFCSVVWEENPYGVLIQKEKLRGGGLVYVVTMFPEEAPLAGVYRVEIRAACSQPEPFFSVLTSDDWVSFSKSTFSQDPLLGFMLRCLAGVHAHRFRRLPISEIAQADVATLAPPKENAYLVDLCAQAYAEKVRCTRAIVPINLIDPDDIEHALAYPLTELKRLRGSHVDSGEAVTELLLYEADGRFIMGDDYSGYLTYKALLFKQVPAVILGSFDESKVEVIRRGGSELIPPILATYGSGRSYRVENDAMVELEHKLAALAPEKSNSHDALEKIYFELCELLHRRSKREADLHSFLRRYPIVLDGHHARAYSEVPIGSYRADLVFRYGQSDKRIVLVELEKDDELIFNKKNRPRQKVVHAVQQVEDWIDSIRRNVPNIPAWLKGAYVVEGLVIIGREKSMDETQKQTLFNLNANRLVKVITYDDLLTRLRSLMTSIERSTTQWEVGSVES